MISIGQPEGTEDSDLDQTSADRPETPAGVKNRDASTAEDPVLQQTRLRS